MSQPTSSSSASNPFSTRFVQPGAIAFLFPADTSADLIVERLRANHWWGQIVGPHGSGKSTLLSALDAPLRAAGRTPFLISLHDNERRLPVALPRREDLGAGIQIIVDGYEQLGRLSRWSLKRRCRRQGWGLLVTAHRSVGLPALFETRTNLENARAIVGQLTASETALIQPADVERAFAARGGNLRDVLFDLYDLVEQRRVREPLGRPELPR